MNHPENLVKKEYLGLPIVGSLDTVPIRSYAFQEGMFTKKYGHEVYKFLLRLDILDPLYGPCKDSKADNRMLTDTKLVETLAKCKVKNARFLSDCAFAQVS